MNWHHTLSLLHVFREEALPEYTDTDLHCIPCSIFEGGCSKKLLLINPNP